jgi:hypothetical protein
MAVGVAANAGLTVAVGIVLTPVLSFMVVGIAPFAALIVAVIAVATAGRRCNLPLAFWIGLLASLLYMCVGIAVSNPHTVLFLN